MEFIKTSLAQTSTLFQNVSTEDDVWRFVDYLRAFEALGNFHV